MFQKLLIPVELGPEAGSIVRFAKKIAAAGAQVRLLHVLVNETTLFYADLLSREEFTNGVQKRFDELKAEFHEAGRFEVEGEIRQGMTVSECIAAEIETYDPDVVVMGSHGRRGLKRWLLGSDVQRVVRETKKPVCMVKGDTATADPLKQVALATDFSPTTKLAEGSFLDLLRSSGAHGHIVNVFESDPWFTIGHTVAVPGGGYSMPVVGKEVEARVEKRREELRTELDELATRARSSGLEVDSQLLEGQAWEMLAEFVEKEKVELLVLGSHHYGGFDRLMLGSVAEKTLRSVGCPVLVVASEGEES